LPTSSPYELAVCSTTSIKSDFLLTDKNRYSVPFDLIGNELSLHIPTKSMKFYK